jgi:hypothetical protein
MDDSELEPHVAAFHDALDAWTGNHQIGHGREDGWVDDHADCIVDALLTAGWSTAEQSAEMRARVEQLENTGQALLDAKHRDAGVMGRDTLAAFAEFGAVLHGHATPTDPATTAHTALVEDLAGTLDTDAGLRAIVGDDDTPADRENPTNA